MRGLAGRNIVLFVYWREEPQDFAMKSYLPGLSGRAWHDTSPDRIERQAEKVLGRWLDAVLDLDEDAPGDPG